jgi:hypothetical protein
LSFTKAISIKTETKIEVSRDLSLAAGLIQFYPSITTYGHILHSILVTQNLYHPEGRSFLFIKMRSKMCRKGFKNRTRKWESLHI